MRSPVVVATGLLLALSGCVAGGDRVALPTFPAVPGFREPTFPLTQPEVLAYCPAIRAEHLVSFPGEPDGVYLCRAGDHRGDRRHQHVRSVGDRVPHRRPRPRCCAGTPYLTRRAAPGRARPTSPIR